MVVYVATNRTAEFAKTAVKIVNRGKVFGTVPMNRLDNLVNYNTYNKLDGKINFMGEITHFLGIKFQCTTDEQNNLSIFFMNFF